VIDVNQKRPVPPAKNKIRIELSEKEKFLPSVLQFEVASMPHWTLGPRYKSHLDGA